uniref:1-phosphatidylinositol-3-phosphate 5-kinase n=1 Tax=Ciona savignyi TaxID=51511 RepID=H2ZJY3_CIOSA
ENSSENLKQYWMPDKHCHECYECGDRFTTFRRRHHCRICGHIFCSRCCYQFIAGAVVDHAAAGMLRSCTYCYSLLMSYTKTTASTAALTSVKSSFQHLNDHDGLTEVKSMNNHNLPPQLEYFILIALTIHLCSLTLPHQRPGRSRSLISIRASPSEDTITSPMMLDNQIYVCLHDSRQGEVKFAKGSVQLHELWANISDDKDGLEFRDHRYRLRKFTQSVTGIELVDWLVMRGITVTRPQGCAIGQALLDAEWIKSVVDDRVFHDEYCLYQHGSNAIESCSYYKSSGPSRPSSEPSLDNEPYWVREISNEEEDNSDDGLHFCPRLEAGLQQPKFVDESVMTISAEYIRSKLTFYPKVGWREKEVSHLPQHIKATLKRLYFQYAMKFLRQLFTRDQLDISWADIIVPLAKEICETVTPNSDVNMEICHYVHVKKLLDNPPEDSRLFWGVVFSQNVVHNMMSSRIDNPVIMLLATPLEYQRGDYKLSSLDPIVRQESEFFKHLVSRIVSRSPDIVISQCSVSHEARRLMLDAGITLLINVKQPVMDRLSRCTGADIAGSIDQLKIARLGTCGRFPLELSSIPFGATTNAYKTLIYVDGCNPSTGCSIILRDKPNYNNRHADYESRQQLARVKSALLFLVRIMYHAKLEVTFHFCNYAAPTAPSSFHPLTHPRGNPSEDVAANSSNKTFSNHLQSTLLRSALSFIVLVGVDGGMSLNPLGNLSLKPSNGGLSINSFGNLSLKLSIAGLSLKPLGKLSLKLSNEGLSLKPLGNLSLKLSNEGLTVTQTLGHNHDPAVSTYLVLSDKHKLIKNRFQPNPLSLHSISPMIQPVVPFLLSESGTNSPLRSYLPDELFWSGSFHCEPSHKHGFSSRVMESSAPNVSSMNGSPKFEKMGWKTPDHVFLTTSLSKPASSETTKDMIASFRARGSNLRVERTEPTLACKDGGEKNMPEILGGDPSPLDCLEPHNHQHIYVLFSSYSLQSPNAPYPCVIPWAVDIDYYHGNDITIGGFLERYCFRPSYQCPSPTCKRPMLEHVRSFVHGNTAMNIILKELSKPVASPHILSWCWNPATKTSTDLKPLSEDGWSMSFAKYLELRLQTYPLRNICGFSPFVSFQYFIYKDIVAAFKCYEVPVYDIFLPSTKVTFNTPTNWMTLDTNHSTFYGAMDSIYDMLMEVKSSVVESTTESEGVTRETHFDELLSLYQEERCQLRDTADDIHLILLTDGLVVNTEESSTLSSSLLELACLICKLVHTWNNRINTVLEQDRSSRRGSKAVLYFNPPVALSPTDASRPKRSPNMMPLQEDQAEKNNLNQRNVGVSGSMAIPGTGDQTHPSSGGGATPGNGNGSSTGVTPGGVSIPGTSGKRYSRTTSSISMRSILTHLRQSANVHVASPFQADEHYLLHDTLPAGHVRDSEPSSIIAYAMSTPAYQRFITKAAVRDDQSTTGDEMLFVENDGTSEFIGVYVDWLVQGTSELIGVYVVGWYRGPVSLLVFMWLVGTRPCTGVDHNKQTNFPCLFTMGAMTPLPAVGMPSNPSVEATPTNSPSHTSPHLELQFSDPTTKFYCKIYFAMEFKELRDQVRIMGHFEEAYMGSLARCARWAARGGKSGSAFHKTLDDRLVIKQMSRFELQSFLDVAPSYMSHITTAVNNKTPTTLSKILGVYRVSFRNNTTNRSFKQDLLIVENLFYKRNIQQVFDLKGSVRNRHVKTEYDAAPNTSASNLISGEKSVTNQNDLVLLDENLLSIMKDHPLYVHQHSKLIIKKALHNDATFLSNHLIIDYSLLVGVDGDSKEIVIGIIDYMRTFTWDKKLEMVVKSYGMIGIQGTRSMPTVVSPQLYKTRFCEAMDRYFQAVPDRWYGLQAYD